MFISGVVLTLPALVEAWTDNGDPKGWGKGEGGAGQKAAALAPLPGPTTPIALLAFDVLIHF